MSDPTRRFLFLLASTRRAGNSEQLARHAARFLPPDAGQTWLYLPDYPLPEFEDLRHGLPYPEPEGHARQLLEATLQATDLVLVTPLYWYSMSVPAKRYLDYWSAWMRSPSTQFRNRMRGKTLWGVVASSGERHEAQPLEDTLKLTAGYMHLPWGGLLFGNGSRPGDVQQDWAALLAAESFFRGE